MLIILLLLLSGLISFILGEMLLVGICAILLICYTFVLILAGKHFEYFYWEEESDPMFPNYHKKNREKLGYKIARILYSQYLNLTYLNEKRKEK